jgi:hypothetical protein
LTSDDYINVASVLAIKLFAILRNQIMTPPLKIHATGADDNTILDLTVGEDSSLETLASGELLNAKIPVTATITDRWGNCREITITQDQQFNSPVTICRLVLLFGIGPTHAEPSPELHRFLEKVPGTPSRVPVNLLDGQRKRRRLAAGT